MSTSGGFPFPLHDVTPPPSIHPSDPVKQCGSAALSILSTRPKTAIRLAHGKLHAYPWREVPVCWRRLFEEGCMWAAWRILVNHPDVDAASALSHRTKRWVDDVVHFIDRAIIISGAEARRKWFNQVLEALGELLSGESEPSAQNAHRSRDEEYKKDDDDDVWELSSRPRKKPRIQKDRHFMSDNISTLPRIPRTFPATPDNAPTPALNSINQMHSLSTPPTLEEFADDLTNLDPPTPFVMSNSIEHWPALQKWPDPSYWHRTTLGGRRLVPVEIGKSYVEEGWGQRLVAFERFLKEGLLGLNDAESTTDFDKTDDHQSTNSAAHSSMRTAYLAQHDLLSQIPSLRNDIAIPDYCYVSAPLNPSNDDHDNDDNDNDSDDPTEPLMNIWLGPAGTISPCHTDPHHNILAQVFGRKYVRLYGPGQGERLYPMGKGGGDDIKDDGGVDMCNTSRVDVGLDVRWECLSKDEETQQEMKAREQETSFPKFRGAEYVEGVLHPGDCLFIPRGWWHYVRSLDVSCSVSFWWD